MHLVSHAPTQLAIAPNVRLDTHWIREQEHVIRIYNVVQTVHYVITAHIVINALQDTSSITTIVNAFRYVHTL